MSIPSDTYNFKVLNFATVVRMQLDQVADLDNNDNEAITSAANEILSKSPFEDLSGQVKKQIIATILTMKPTPNVEKVMKSTDAVFKRKPSVIASAIQPSISLENSKLTNDFKEGLKTWNTIAEKTKKKLSLGIILNRETPLNAEKSETAQFVNAEDFVKNNRLDTIVNEMVNDFSTEPERQKLLYEPIADALMATIQNSDKRLNNQQDYNTKKGVDFRNELEEVTETLYKCLGLEKKKPKKISTNSQLKNPLRQQRLLYREMAKEHLKNWQTEYKKLDKQYFSQKEYQFNKLLERIKELDLKMPPQTIRSEIEMAIYVIDKILKKLPLEGIRGLSLGDNKEKKILDFRSTLNDLWSNFYSISVSLKSNLSKDQDFSDKFIKIVDLWQKVKETPTL